MSAPDNPHVSRVGTNATTKTAPAAGWITQKTAEQTATPEVSRSDGSAALTPKVRFHNIICQRGQGGLNFASLRTRLFSVHGIRGLIPALHARCQKQSFSFCFVRKENPERTCQRQGENIKRGPFLAPACVVDSVERIPSTLTVGTTCSAASNISPVLSCVAVAVPLWNIPTDRSHADEVAATRISFPLGTSF